MPVTSSKLWRVTLSLDVARCPFGREAKLHLVESPALESHNVLLEVSIAWNACLFIAEMFALLCRGLTEPYIYSSNIWEAFTIWGWNKWNGETGPGQGHGAGSRSLKGDSVNKIDRNFGFSDLEITAREEWHPSEAHSFTFR